jgi:hypothetical protein
MFTTPGIDRGFNGTVFVQSRHTTISASSAMKTAKRIDPSPAPFQEVDLLRLELLVAKRADRLWTMAGCGRGRDLVHWLQAESEVLRQHFGHEEHADSVLVAER